ncbi:hypothetical protein KY290_033119 [Solanum tuberosum]|uniref:Endonuclease/exonuclease/phosphatase domain-containing protein n=1 Tax=Solanum tuberosum TaxID=4113 RepID=A0ABQ7TZU1_SOLTU|nr:hypothetical protein KY290_033119 [Solanum tuberosum]
MDKYTKIVTAKTCKAFGVNVNGFEHEILEMILRMEQKRKLQLQQQREKQKDAKSSKGKGDGEVKNLICTVNYDKGVHNEGGRIMKGLQGDLRWCFTGVYGPHSNWERTDFWDELADIRGLWTDHWVVGGDFNVSRSNMKGAHYTWYKSEDSTQASRIDRFLISTDWSDNFGAVNQLAFPKVTSDHRPIVLESGDWSANPSYFKFENMWLQHDGFTEKVKEWWQSYNVNGSPDYILAQNLKHLKRDISKWNKEESGSQGKQSVG